jgi:hypothetical protein
MKNKTLTMANLTGKTVVYFIYAPGARAIKIGYTCDLPSRIASIACGCPFELIPAAIVFGDAKTEGAIHRELSAHSLRGEWFDDVPAVWEYVRANAFLITEEIECEQFSEDAIRRVVKPADYRDDSPHRALNSKNIREAFEAANINETQRAVLSMRFGLVPDMVRRTLSEISGEIKMTGSRASQIEREALSKLRNSRLFDGLELPYDVLYAGG